MEFDRIQLKQYARMNMRGKRPSVLLVSLVYLLLTTGLSSVVSQLAFGPFNETVAVARANGLTGTELIELIREQGMDLGITLAVGTVLTVVVSLFATVIQVGYTSYTLALAKGEQAGFGRLLTGFGMLGRALGLNIMVTIFTLLWTLAIFVPLTLAVVALVTLLEGMEWLAALLLVVGAIGGYVLLLARVLRYALAVYALVEHPEGGVFGAIERSKKLMKGRRWEYMKLMLSFVGWILLLYVVMMMVIYAMAFVLAVAVFLGGSVEGFLIMITENTWVLTMVAEGIMLLFLMWLQPYMELTRTHFYLALSTRQRPPEPPRIQTPPADGGTPPAPPAPPAGEKGPEDPWDRPADSRRNPDDPF